MEDLKLTAPEQGETLVIKLDGTYDTLSFGFPLENVFFERTDNDLILSFDNQGSSIVLKDFYTIFNAETAPKVVSQNGILDGQTFLAQLGDDMTLAEAEGPLKQTRRENSESPEQLASNTDGFTQTSFEQDGIDLENFTAKVNIQLVGSRALASLDTSSLPSLPNTSNPSIPSIDPLAPQASIVLGTGASAFIMPSQLQTSAASIYSLTPTNDQIPITGTLTLKNMDFKTFSITLVIDGTLTYVINKDNYDQDTGIFTILIDKTALAGLTSGNPSFAFSISDGASISAPSNPLHLVHNYTQPVKVGETYIANEALSTTLGDSNLDDKFAIAKLTSSTLKGLAGNDVFAVDVMASSSIDAGSGNDTIKVTKTTNSSNSIYGDEASLPLSSQGGNDLIQIVRPGGALDPEAGNFYGTIYGDAAITQANTGNDTIEVDSLFGTIYGDSHTWMSGELGDDKIIVDIMNSNSSIYADSYNSSSYGGNDTVQIGEFNGTTITIDGGTGNDTFIYTNSANQTIVLDNSWNVNINGLDSSISITGFENITTGSGNDNITGNIYDNRISGGGGIDRIYGGEGSDTINGNAGNDYLYGENGDDFIYGGSGNDTIDGGAGNDKIYGGLGDDILDGGDGADVFIWRASDITESANDIVYADAEDSLDLTAFKEAGFDISVSMGSLSTSGAVGYDIVLTNDEGITHTIGLGTTSGITQASIRDQYEANDGYINM